LALFCQEKTSSFFVFFFFFFCVIIITTTKNPRQHNNQHKHNTTHRRSLRSTTVSGHCNDAICEKHASHPYSGSRGISNEVHPVFFLFSLLLSSFFTVVVADVSCINGRSISSTQPMAAQIRRVVSRSLLPSFLWSLDFSRDQTIVLKYTTFAFD
jgi:hypothetical protein